MTLSLRKAKYSQPAITPIRVRGIIQRYSISSVCTGSIEAKPVEVPVSLLSRKNIPKELRPAVKYKTVLEVFGRAAPFSFSRGSTKPNIGERKMVPRVALTPIRVSSSISAWARLSLSPIHVQKPAITPVKPASGPTLAPKISGKNAAPSIIGML